MSAELHDQIYNELNLRETEDLVEIWQTHDQEQWSDTAFDAIREILMQRLGELPVQPGIVEEEESAEDDGLEEWKAKLLDNENQPEFYDTLQVLSLRDSLDKVATAASVVYSLLGLLKLQIVFALLQGVPLSVTGIIQALPYDLFTILSTGLQIAITYFSLKALAHILRILMEMEFRSRREYH
jgi:hypothetical protein